MLNTGRLFMIAWRYLPYVPSWIVRGAFDLVARFMHVRRGKSIRQLEANLNRVTGLEGADLRALSKVGIRRYMLYYAEAFQLPRVAPEQLVARVRCVNTERLRYDLSRETVVAGAGHVGNWDLAGAWAEINIGHVITVAEKLKPEELFEQFLQFREGLGLEILAYEKGSGLFDRLVEAAQTNVAFMPLLADRDLSANGIEVTIAGHPMRVAPGPAAVALAAGVPFIGVFIHHERIHGARRRAARSPWGIVIEFTDPIPVPANSDNPVQEMMQAWADLYGAFLQKHPEDWHMLQKCFVADLDSERLKEADEGMYG